MNDMVVPSLQINRLDQELFPEFSMQAGEYAVQVRWVSPLKDKSLPLPDPLSPAIIVGYRFLATQAPADSTWQLTVIRTQPDGKRSTQAFRLFEKHSGKDNEKRLSPPASTQVRPGQIFRGVYWVDLSELTKRKIIQSGDQMTLSYGESAKGPRANFSSP
jgi:hypothetical protein